MTTAATRFASGPSGCANHIETDATFSPSLPSRLFIQRAAYDSHSGTAIRQSLAVIQVIWSVCCHFNERRRLSKEGCAEAADFTLRDWCVSFKH